MSSEQKVDCSQTSVTVKCSNCKHKFSPSNLQLLVAPTADLTALCPKCNKSAAVATREIGCPTCNRSVWISPLIMGNGVQCPHCQSALPLPTEDQWKELEKKAAAFQWTVLSLASGQTLAFDSLGSLTAAITNGEVVAGDACTAHAFAPREKLRTVCDRHFALRKLYDPVGAWVEHVGDITGATLVILFILASIIRGLWTMGGTFLLSAIFGIAAVFLTPTVLGLFVVYLIARACHVPLLWPYFGVLLAVLICAILFFLGKGLGRLTMFIIAKLTSLNAKRVVLWE